MILLIEGQRPIFGEKLRFFKTNPFKSAEEFSQANIPQVPEVEYLPPKAIPATTPEYAKGGVPSIETTSPAPTIEERPAAAAMITSAPANQDATVAEEETTTTARRTVNKKALQTKPKPATAKADAVASASLAAMEARIKAIEEGLTPKAAQLKATVEAKAEKLGDKPAARRNFMDIFNTTVPDPVEVGVAAV